MKKTILLLIFASLPGIAENKINKSILESTTQSTESYINKDVHFFVFKLEQNIYKCILCDLTKIDLLYYAFDLYSQIFPNIKLINRYTKRGLRFKRQAIIRRFGKISQHISSLH